MRVGYFTNTYPATSSTFIRREINALEEQDVVVRRYAVRRWPQELVDDRDKAEQDQTQYLLSGQVANLLIGFFPEVVRNPSGVFRAVSGMVQLIKNQRGGLVRHVAYLLEAIRLKALARHDEIHHIHVHFSTNATAVALLCKRLGGPSYSFTAHGPDEFNDASGNSLSLKVQEAEAVVAISHYCRSQILLAAGNAAWDKIHVIGCGIDTDEFSLTPPSQDANAAFVVIGRLCPQKAQVLITRAVAQVAQTDPSVRVLMVGDGESRTEVEFEIGRLGLQDNISLLGWQSGAEVKDHLKNGRVLLLPSFAEGLPVGIMESLALGRPAISSFIAGIPELVDEKCGWLVPAGSVDHIAQAMLSALDTSTEDLAAMGLEGRRRVVERHNSTKNAHELYRLFEAIEKRP